MADYTKEPEQINIDIENVGYSDETDEPEIKEEIIENTEEDEKETQKTIEGYNEVISMLGDFEDED